MLAVEWRKAARNDLFAIVDYISDDNPDAAQRLNDDHHLARAARRAALAARELVAQQFLSLHVFKKTTVADLLAKQDSFKTYEITPPNGIRINATGEADHKLALEALGQIQKLGSLPLPPCLPNPKRGFPSKAPRET